MHCTTWHNRCSCWFSSPSNIHSSGCIHHKEESMTHEAYPLFKVATRAKDNDATAGRDPRVTTAVRLPRLYIHHQLPSALIFVCGLIRASYFLLCLLHLCTHLNILSQRKSGIRCEILRFSQTSTSRMDTRPERNACPASIFPFSATNCCTAFLAHTPHRRDAILSLT